VKRTRVCDPLGIEYPIIQGGMAWIADAQPAAEASCGRRRGAGVSHVRGRSGNDNDLASAEDVIRDIVEGYGKVVEGLGE
jgi:NAD(P)H-dependent flavin oxidoreductase YrpB (nitropropane dioxygenase family)